MVRNVIFDWSGTLIDDLPAVWAATNHVLEKAGVGAMSLDRFRSEFSLPFQGFYRRFAAHVDLPQLEEWYHGRFREVQDQVRELPHARRFLEFCRDRGCRTFLLSTIHRSHYHAQSSALGLSELIGKPYVEAWDKKEWIHRVLSENALRPEETLFVGDMQHDIETAHHGAVLSCAVLTGYNRLEQLRQSRPHLIVEHLGELQSALERGSMEFPPLADTASTGAIGDRRHRAPVGALIYNDRGEVLMIRTHKWSDRWGIPGGKIQWGEPSESALAREIREETALEVESIRFVMVQDCIHSTEFYRDAHFLLLNYTCRVRGTPQVVLNEEAQTFSWCLPTQAMELDLNQPTRRLLEAVLESPSGGGTPA